MSERWRQQVAFGTTGAQGLQGGQLRLVDARAERDAQFATRLNVFRQQAAHEHVRSKWGCRLREEWNDLQANLWTQASATLVAGSVYEIAEATGNPQLFTLSGLGSVDGAQVELQQCALAEWQITIAETAIVASDTTWVARKARSIANAQPTLPVATTSVTQCESRLLLGGEEALAMSANLVLARDIRPGQYDESGDANAWLGQSSMAITGRATLRLPASRLLEALLAMRTTSLSLIIGGWHIDIPAVRMAARNRVLVDQRLYDHEVEFVAVQASSRLATITTA